MPLLEKATLGGIAACLVVLFFFFFLIKWLKAFPFLDLEASLFFILKDV